MGANHHGPTLHHRPAPGRHTQPAAQPANPGRHKHHPEQNRQKAAAGMDTSATRSNRPRPSRTTRPRGALCIRNLRQPRPTPPGCGIHNSMDQAHGCLHSGRSHYRKIPSPRYPRKSRQRNRRQTPGPPGHKNPKPPLQTPAGQS